MTIHDETIFARRLINDVIEVLQTDADFTTWFAGLGTEAQFRLSDKLRRAVRENIRDIETFILKEKFQ